MLSIPPYPEQTMCVEVTELDNKAIALALFPNCTLQKTPVAVSRRRKYKERSY